MSRKQNTILLIIFVLTFFVISLSATLSFFIGQQVSFESKKENVSSVTMETLVFNAGEPINFHASSENFALNMPSLVGKTETSATLIAGSDHRLASYKYNVDLELNTNDFVYTNGKEPELLLVAYDPEGKIIQSIPNLEYKKVGDYSGFDITGKTGHYPIFHDYVIETDTTVTQTWRFEVIFINYPTNQDLNKNKTLNGYFRIGQEGDKA